MKHLHCALFLAGVFVFPSAVPGDAAAATQVYLNNFDGTETFSAGATGALSGVTTTATSESLPAPLAGRILHNNTGGSPVPPPVIPGLPTILTVSNLPAHSSLDLDFQLLVIDTWDGIGGFPNGGSDQLNVLVDGVPVFAKIFAWQSGVSNYSPPPGVYLGLGAFGSGGQTNDRAYNMALEPVFHGIPHTASSVTIQFFADGPGWQGGTDESFGLDNLSISTFQAPTPVPVAPFWSLVALAALLLGVTHAPLARVVASRLAGRPVGPRALPDRRRV